MIKTFIIGAIPVGLFMYLGVFHTTVFFVLLMGCGLALASYFVGEAIREEFLNDRN
jgi:uncharacterized membrane protein